MNIFQALLHEIKNGKDVWLATAVDGEVKEEIGSQTLYGHDGTVLAKEGSCHWELAPPFSRTAGVSRVHTQKGDIEVMMEPLSPPPTLVIFGSGHIAGYLASMAKLLTYRVIVVDDRSEFANPDKFSQADQIICGPFEEAIGKLSLHSGSYAVIVTRGHRTDAVCLSKLLNRPLPYIGMVGSKRKIRFIYKLLEEQGLNPSGCSKLHSPVGLDLHSETPQEIAFSILAELQQLRCGGTAKPLSSLEHADKVHPHDDRRMRQDLELFAAMAQAREEGRSFASITIIHAAGHVPRGVGSRAILWEDGSIYRTIGGGRRESEIMELAQECLRKGQIQRKEVHFSGSYDDFQPVCGGRYTFLIQPYLPPATVRSATAG